LTVQAEPTTVNARIVSTLLGPEDHGILTAQVIVELAGGVSQGFGGYFLDTWDDKRRSRVGTAYGTEFIRRTLAALDIDAWEKLPRTYCRVLADYSKIHAIGHIFKDQWFEPAKDLAFLVDPARPE
jgi:hypothetical protein